MDAPGAYSSGSIVTVIDVAPIRRWHRMTNMRNFCERLYGSVSQLIQMGSFL